MAAQITWDEAFRNKYGDGNSLRNEQVEWFGYNFIPPKNGSYYCRVATFHHEYYSSIPFENGEWILGSSLLMGAKVIEWMRQINN